MLYFFHPENNQSTFVCTALNHHQRRLKTLCSNGERTKWAPRASNAQQWPCAEQIQAPEGRHLTSRLTVFVTALPARPLCVFSGCKYAIYSENTNSVWVSWTARWTDTLTHASLCVLMNARCQCTIFQAAHSVKLLHTQLTVLHNIRAVCISQNKCDNRNLCQQSNN